MERSIVVRRAQLARALRIVPYLTSDEVNLLASEARKRRKGERDTLLILLLYQTGLRISEALSLTPSHIESFKGRPVLRFTGKGGKERVAALPKRLADKLRAYAYEKGIKINERFFPINRQRSWQIIKEVSQKAGITKGVYPHLLRHSDAIERLRQTGNPKALQHHLGHSSPIMVMRYLSTLTQEDSLGIQQQVDFEEG